jgi:hypothetical protein
LDEDADEDEEEEQWCISVLNSKSLRLNPAAKTKVRNSFQALDSDEAAWPMSSAAKAPARSAWARVGANRQVAARAKTASAAAVKASTRRCCCLLQDERPDNSLM